MNRKKLITLAGLGSAGLLLGAFAFQHIGGLPPCKMCIWQRYPHAIAIIIAVLAMAFPWRILPLAGLMAALTTAVVGFYHTGVERKWWEGPTSCTSGSVADLTPQQLMEQILAAPLIRCDDVAWSLMGLSMASWNAVISLVLAAIWFAALRRN